MTISLYKESNIKTLHSLLSSYSYYSLFKKLRSSAYSSVPQNQNVGVHNLPSNLPYKESSYSHQTPFFSDAFLTRYRYSMIVFTQFLENFISFCFHRIKITQNFFLLFFLVFILRFQFV